MTTKPIDRQRHLRWYVESESGPTVHHWSFVIVNTPGETERITDRARQILAPTDNEQIPTSGRVEGSDGLHYTLLTIDSHKFERPNNQTLTQIYNGRVVKDRNLEQHSSSDGPANYVDNMFSR